MSGRKMRSAERAQKAERRAARLERNRLVYNRLIARGDYQMILDEVIRTTPLTISQGHDFWNSIRGSAGNYRIEITMKNETQFIPVNEVTREFIMNVLTEELLLKVKKPSVVMSWIILTFKKLKVWRLRSFQNLSEL